MAQSKPQLFNVIEQQRFSNLETKRKQIVENLAAVKKENERSFTSLALPATYNLSDGIFIQIERLSSDKDFPESSALENVLSIYRNLPVRMIYYIKSDGVKISFYLGVRALDPKLSGQSLEPFATMLENSLKGSFRGTLLKPNFHQAANENGDPSSFFYSRKVFEELIGNNNLRFSSIVGIPSIYESQDEKETQSLDRLLHSMNGKAFHIVITWDCLENVEVNDLEVKVNEIYKHIYSFCSSSASFSWQDGKSHSDNTHEIKDSQKKQRDTSESDSWSESFTVNDNACDRSLIDLQEYIDKELKPRLKEAKAKGLYHTAIYLGADKEKDLSLLESAFISVFQSDKPSAAPLRIKKLPHDLAVNYLVSSAKIVSNLQTQASWISLFGRYLNNYTSIASCLTLKELCFIAGFPHSDVPGLEIRKRVSFGLNYPEAKKNALTLGNLLQDGGKLNLELKLEKEDLEKHVFIAGTTGSGKTTTCQRILHEFNGPFMVIEPAKTEYRVLINDPTMRDTLIFTVGSEAGVPFRINPFEFLPSENLSSHIDSLKACFMACFDMEAAIPNLLEEAMYRVYKQFGWDITTNDNFYLQKREEAWDLIWRGMWFPTISEYIQTVIQVIQEKGFDERLKDEYIGSIRARLESLTVGVKGRVLNSRLSIDFNWLVAQKVIIELEDLKSGDDKSFVMALIVTRLLEALKARNKKEASSFQHVLLIEEAHRLLSRSLEGEGSSRKLGVEILTDMLAEVRKYHESLIIVDQIPSKLAPEVLKNTNTKIIHRLFADDDKKAVGDAIALNDKQESFISMLGVGEVIVSGNGWSKAVHAKISQVSQSNTDLFIEDDKAFKKGREFWFQHINILCPYFPYGFLKDLPYSKENIDYKLEVSQKLLFCAQIINEYLESLFNNKLSSKKAFENWLKLNLYLKSLLKKVNVQDDKVLEQLSNTVISQSLFIRSLLQAQVFSFDLKQTIEDAKENAKKLLAYDEKVFKACVGDLL